MFRNRRPQSYVFSLSYLPNTPLGFDVVDINCVTYWSFTCTHKYVCTSLESGGEGGELEDILRGGPRVIQKLSRDLVQTKNKKSCLRDQLS